MKKFGYISNAQLPSKTANSIHIAKMSNAFLNNGWKVWLSGCIDKNKKDELHSYYSISKQVKLISHSFLHSTRFISAFSTLLITIKMKLLGVTLIVSRDLLGAYLTSVLRIPTYYEIHTPNTKHSFLRKTIFKSMLKKRKFKKIILITESLNSWYLKEYPELQGKTLVLPDGADEPTQINKEAFKFNTNFNLGYAGHLYEGKGMEIIEKLSVLAPDYFFHIAGGRPKDIAYWKEKIKTSNVKFYGHLEHSQVIDFLSACDVLLLPNQAVVKANNGDDIGQWTSPLKLFEYMSINKPIVCSDLTVLKEIVTHEKTVLLAAYNDPEAWLEQVNRLFENPKLAQDIASNAYIKFINNYTWQKRAEKIYFDSV